MPKYYINGDGVAYLWSKVENKIKHNLVYHSGTTAQWNAEIFISEKDVLYIYTDYKAITKNNQEYFLPGLKVGDGVSYLIDLPFLNENENSVFNQTVVDHMNNDTAHITEGQRTFWNDKLNYDESQLQNETLVLNRS